MLMAESMKDPKKHKGNMVLRILENLTKISVILDV